MKGSNQMNKKIAEYSNLKPVCSIADLTKLLGISRAHFFYCKGKGIFPEPIYSIHNKRPLYTLEMQMTCLEIRESNIGYNGQYVLWYAPRKAKTEKDTTAPVKRKTRIDKTTQEFADTLSNMGLSVTADQISTALNELYSDGIGTMDHGVVIRNLYRYFKNGV